MGLGYIHAIRSVPRPREVCGYWVYDANGLDVRIKWQKPMAGVAEMNVDATFTKARATIGMVAFDELGSVQWLWRSIITMLSTIKAKLMFLAKF